MKQIIVMMGILPILIAFSMNQFVNNQNSIKEMEVRETIYTAVQVAKIEGCFTKTNTDELVEKIAKIMNLDEDEIIIDADSVPRYKTNVYNETELIRYRIVVPVKQIIGGNRMFGISDKDNQGSIVIEDEVSSERLRP